MNRHTTLAVACAATATAVMGWVATPAQAITLGELVDSGDNFIVGEKKFTFDTCNIVTGGAGLATPFTCDDIEVISIVDGDFTGFRLQSIFSAINTSLIDVLVEYTLEGVDPGKLFSGAKLAFNGDGNPDGGFVTGVTEQFTDMFDNIVGQINVTNPPPVFVDEITFDSPVSKLFVSKDIGLAAFVTPAQANISFVDQTFTHESVPEPGTVSGLLAIGSLSIGAIVQRRRANKA
ncbi:MAG: PEP-CTERM sorting domain-containing protein [Coleofasciculus sp. B1-GNL1-01]|uniref:PEP-CTERM sorting domain-containing protein n=1 Tax=Coleofasciculus sp. B1-GNL1-01 TaxID=3068484 RepID=UPI0032F9B567